ncbi:hypothetical protein [Roseivivax sp. CAU 1753]
MARRYFRCPNCTHRLRFNTSECSVCGAPTPMLNRLPVLLILVAGCVAIIFGVARTVV